MEVSYPEDVSAARALRVETHSIADDLTALEREMSSDDEENIRHELQTARDAFGGDLEAELRAWRDGDHPLHPTRLAT